MYSNSSFKAMPLWEKHCWQIRAYLHEKEKWTCQSNADKAHGNATLAITANLYFNTVKYVITV